MIMPLKLLLVINKATYSDAQRRSSTKRGNGVQHGEANGSRFFVLAYKAAEIAVAWGVLKVQYITRLGYPGTSLPRLQVLQIWLSITTNNSVSKGGLDGFTSPK
jgi:hypothetical protein